MADDTYDPFNLRKHPGYYAELVQERDPTHDVAANFAKTHAYDGGILSKLENNPGGWGDSPLPYDPAQPELRSTSEGGSAFTARPKDHMQPVAELISPTLGAFGAGQMAGTAYKEAGEGDYQEAGMSLAPLLAGMVVPGAPKGARGPKAITREIDARGFYSPSLEAVKGLGQETGTVQQFRSMLLKAGGKPKELEAVGFDRAFPDPNAKVSRQEIEQYLRDNRVQLGEEIHGPARAQMPNQGMLSPEQAEGRYESYSTPGGIPGSYREVVTTLPAREQWETVPDPRSSIRADFNGPVQMNMREAENYTSSHWPGITNPLLHYRTKDFVSGDRAAPADTSRLLRSHNAEAGSSPSPQNGIREGGTDQLAARGQTEPSKVRVLDEMQSDWAQRARDQGTRDPVAAEQLTKTLREAEAAQKQAYDEATTFIKAIDPDGMHYGQKLRWGAVPEVLDSLSGYENHAAKAKELKAKIAPLDDRVMDLQNKVGAATQGVPSAPYISNTSDWVDLGLKQALIDAAKDPSVNRLAWAPGKVQADRYNLANQVGGLRYDPQSHVLSYLPAHVRSAYGERAGGLSDQFWQTAPDLVTPEQLPGAVGKEVAERLLAQPTVKEGWNRDANYHQMFLDDDITMGGEGMKSFYGDMTPEGYQSGIVGTRLQKLVKGLDPEAAKIEPHGLNPDYGFPDSAYTPGAPPPVRPEMRGYKQTYPSIPITPAMREKILKEGLPLFNVAALSALVSRILGQGQPDTEGEDGGGF
jgi:hypothetical protein